MTDKPMRTAVRKVRNCGYKPLKILTFDEAVHEPRVSDTTSKKEFVFIPDLKARLLQLRNDFCTDDGGVGFCMCNSCNMIDKLISELEEKK